MAVSAFFDRIKSLISSIVMSTDQRIQDLLAENASLKDQLNSSNTEKSDILERLNTGATSLEDEYSQFQKQSEENAIEGTEGTPSTDEPVNPTPAADEVIKAADAADADNTDAVQGAIDNTVDTDQPTDEAAVNEALDMLLSEES